MDVKDMLDLCFDPSQALEAISDCDAQSLTSIPRAWGPEGAPPGRRRHESASACQRHTNFHLLEALAQTCGMHLRFCHDFQIMAYLVSVNNLIWPLQAGRIRAELTTRTKNAARYQVRADDGIACTIVMGYREMDDAAASAFFRERFLCLRNASCKS